MVQEGGRRCKKSTLNDLVHLTPLRIHLMNPPSVYRRGRKRSWAKKPSCWRSTLGCSSPLTRPWRMWSSSQMMSSSPNSSQMMSSSHKSSQMMSSSHNSSQMMSSSPNSSQMMSSSHNKSHCLKTLIMSSYINPETDNVFLHKPRHW